MIGKITKRKGAAKVVEYDLDDAKSARLIGHAFVDITSRQSMTDSIDLNSAMNLRVRKNVGHIALAFSPEDTLMLTDELMRTIAEEYMYRMGIRNTPYIISRHLDKKHQHVHIAFSRVDNDGNVISDTYDYKQNEETCKLLNVLYGLHWAKGKEHVNINRLRKDDKTKYEIYLLLKKLLEDCQSWKQLQEKLAAKGVTMVIKRYPNTGAAQGISFCKGVFKFKGSEIDRSMSYSKINQRLEMNARMEESTSPYRHHTIGRTSSQSNKIASTASSSAPRTQRSVAHVPTSFSGGYANRESEVSRGNSGKRWDEMSDEEKQAASRGMKI